MATYSVSQALAAAKSALEGLTMTVVGEVSEFKDKASYSAAYFSIGDAGGVLNCMMWHNRYEASGMRLREGMLVEVTGRFTLYEKKGRMNFTVNHIQAAGEGSLKAMIAARLEKLRREGLFDDERKRAVPTAAQKIAVITSPQGKAVHDVLRTLKRRFALSDVFFYGVRVEGESAPSEIVHALELADDAGYDVILLVRGGGSYEDLLPFSEEAVVRAVAACETPVVTGVGHEPDVTLVDYAADVRASTPTAAAERVTPSREEIEVLLARSASLMSSALKNTVDSARQRLSLILTRPILTEPQYWLESNVQTLDDLRRRLERALPDKLGRDTVSLATLRARLKTVAPAVVEKPRMRCGVLAGKLESLSPLKVLSRGYAAVFNDTTHTVITSAASVTTGDDIRVAVADGSIECTVKQALVRKEEA